MAEEHDENSAMFSRTGITHEDGKLKSRIDVPLTDALHDVIVVKAAQAGKPKAEYARLLMQEAITSPILLGLPADVRESLCSLANVAGRPANELALQMLGEAIEKAVGMTRIIVRKQVLGQSEDCPGMHG